MLLFEGKDTQKAQQNLRWIFKFLQGQVMTEQLISALLGTGTCPSAHLHIETLSQPDITQQYLTQLY